MQWPRPDDPGLPRLEGFEVRRIPGARATKAYTCPACHNLIGRGVGHVVVWPDRLLDDRRHWHLHCWRVAARRGRLA